MQITYPVQRVLSPFGESFPVSDDDEHAKSPMSFVQREIEFLGAMHYDNTWLWLGTSSGHLFRIAGNPGWPDTTWFGAGHVGTILQVHMRRYHVLGNGDDIFRESDPSAFVFLDHVIGWEYAGQVDNKYESGPATTILLRSGNRLSIAGTAEEFAKLYEEQHPS